MTQPATSPHRPSGATAEFIDHPSPFEPAPETAFGLVARALSGADVRVVSADVVEALNTAYEATIEFDSADCDLDLEALLGDRAVLTITRGPRLRQVCGIVRRVEWLESWGEHRRGRVWLVPALWVLSQQTDCKIFQDLTAIEIVSKVLAATGRSDLTPSLDLRRTYARRAHCTQYRETDLAFMMRLLEDEGVTWYFRHGGEAESLVLTDAPTWALVPTMDQQPVPFSPQAGIASVETVRRLAQACEFRPTDRMVNRGGDLERQVSGNGDVSGFMPGTAFELSDHGRPDLDARYLLTRVEHHLRASEELLTEGEPRSRWGHATGPYRYTNVFGCVPSSVPWMPMRRTPRPVVLAAHTATVVGSTGEAVHVDAQGRIRVRFHWDGAGERDASSSCWVRVARWWAGGGTTFVPQVGMDVVIHFLEGDPDRPIVTGCVSDGECPMPNTLRDVTSPGTTLEIHDERGSGSASGGAGAGGGSVTKGTSTEDTPIKVIYASTNMLLICGGSHIALFPSDIGIGADVVSTDAKDVKITGGNSVYVEGGMVSVKGNTMLKLECGGSEIVMDSDSISIRASRVAISGSPISLNG